MPLLVPEPPIFGRGLVAAELGPNGSVHQVGQVVRDFDVRAKAEEYVVRLAGLVLLARQTRQSQKFATAPTQSSSGMRFLRQVSYARRSHGASRISTSVSDRS